MAYPPITGAAANLPKELQKFLSTPDKKAQDAQYPVYLVGGCVRDLLLNRAPVDIDIVVEEVAAPLAKSAAQAYKAKVVHHPQFLTYTLQLSNGRHLDIATARRESYPESAALPVVEAASLQEDLYRRDSRSTPSRSR